jgi:glyoxylase-like metal-dependent hydrolase (beta-lactamase superfamily II)
MKLRISVVVALAGGVAALIASALGPRPALGQTRVHTVQKLGEGVYGIRAPYRGATGSDMNTGFVVGDNGVFVFACNIRDFEQRMIAIRTVTDKPIRWAGIGHYAFDDSSCAWHFQQMGATIFSSGKMREEFLSYGPARYERELATPAGQRTWEGKAVVMPDVTFDDKIVLHLGEGREVHLVYAGHGHTRGDSFAYLPQQRVLFTADLLFVGEHPTVRDGDSANWQRILERLMGLEVDWIVSGHGDIVQGKEWLQTMHEYFGVMRERVRGMIQQGMGVEEIKAHIDISPYNDWSRPDSVGETIEKLYHEIRAKG